MNRIWRILLHILIWGGIICYLVFATKYCTKREDQQICTKIKVSITDSRELGFITEPMVLSWFTQAGVRLRGEPLGKINTVKAKRLICSHGYVKDAKVYKDKDGILNIQITQRKPFIRFIDNRGGSYYLTEDNWILPSQVHAFSDVPVVTGALNFPFAKDFSGEIKTLSAKSEKKVAKSYRFLYKLINFVRFLDSNDLWRSDIVQINVAENGDIELIPRIGDQIIILGDLENYQSKMAKLEKFYRDGLNYDGWYSYKYINLKFKNQVVCH